MAPYKPRSRCTNCKRLFNGTGKCPDCQAAAEHTLDQRRGSARQRGYNREHETRFRATVLQRDPICVLCRTAPSTVADHYPTSRRDLEQQGLDPNDPQYGRGLCNTCHGRETAKRQPGGWLPH